MFAATDGVHVLCEHVVQAIKLGKVGEFTQGQLTKAVGEVAQDPHLVVNTGLPGLATAVRRLQDWAGEQEESWQEVIGLLRDELPSADEVLGDGGDRLQAWLQATGLSGPLSASGRFRICRHIRASV